MRVPSSSSPLRRIFRCGPFVTTSGGQYIHFCSEVCSGRICFLHVRHANFDCSEIRYYTAVRRYLAEKSPCRCLSDSCEVHPHRIESPHYRPEAAPAATKLAAITRCIGKAQQNVGALAVVSLSAERAHLAAHS